MDYLDAVARASALRYDRWNADLMQNTRLANSVCVNTEHCEDLADCTKRLVTKQEHHSMQAQHI